MAREAAFALTALIVAATLVAADPLGAQTVPAPQYDVFHPPRVQLGDAASAGYPGTESDRVHLIWQTLPAGPGSEDSFDVEYREAGVASWTPAESIGQADLEVDGRVSHSVDLIGLKYGHTYQYRVHHLRGGSRVATYTDHFATRLAPGDATPFSFVAYGDSADGSDGFRAVQARINDLDPEFALLLGDNAYDYGSYADYDARLDPLQSPEATGWAGGQIDFVAYGNHDILTDGGAPTEHLYDVPVPNARVDALVAPPQTERPEHNYSFDYGSAHFVTFDSNAYDEPARLDALLTWVEADLAASDAVWKIVFGHHPLAGVPDKDHDPSNDYYRQVVSRLLAAGADLFLAGHSHTFGWTYPLTGWVGVEATFVADTDGDFAKGAGLVQVIAGTGGNSLRPGTFDKYGFVAAGYSTTTEPSAEYGVAHIEVSPGRLTVSYVAADDGARLGSFTLTESAPDSQDAVGLVDPQTGIWHLRDAYTGAVTSFYYGNPKDVPFMGDWDCDRVGTPGLYRQADGFAYLRNSNTQGNAEIRFFFGNPSDIPLAGDFNGDGCDTLSLYRPSTQEFFIVNKLGENEGGLGAADFSFLFGNPGDKPVVGDWDGDGIDEVGLYRESTGLFYWRNTLDAGIASGEILFGDPGDRFVAGDWGVINGVNTPAVFRPSATTFFFRHTLTQGIADSEFVFGQSGWLPVAGEFGLG